MKSTVFVGTAETTRTDYTNHNGMKTLAFNSPYISVLYFSKSYNVVIRLFCKFVGNGFFKALFLRILDACRYNL